MGKIDRPYVDTSREEIDVPYKMPPLMIGAMVWIGYSIGMFLLCLIFLDWRTALGVGLLLGWFSMILTDKK